MTYKPTLPIRIDPPDEQRQLIAFESWNLTMGRTTRTNGDVVATPVGKRTRSRIRRGRSGRARRLPQLVGLLAPSLLNTAAASLRDRERLKPGNERRDSLSSLPSVRPIEQHLARLKRGVIERIQPEPLEMKFIPTGRAMQPGIPPFTTGLDGERFGLISANSAVERRSEPSSQIRITATDVCLLIGGNSVSLVTAGGI